MAETGGQSRVLISKMLLFSGGVAVPKQPPRRFFTPASSRTFAQNAPDLPFLDKHYMPKV
jgi:hypothetical protein